MLRLIPLFFLFVCSNFAFAQGIDSYFKKAENKGKHHSMKRIDFIYMINLDERPEKYALSLQQLLPYKITPYRFSAVNGWKLPSYVFRDVAVKYDSSMAQDLMGTTYDVQFPEPCHELMSVKGRSYFCHCMSRGAVAIVSHLSVLQDAYDSGYETIWVMEDDIQIVKDPTQLSDHIKSLDKTVGKKGWDILFTDPDTKNREGHYVPCLSFARRPNFSPKNPLRFATRVKINNDFTQIGARYGTYSMIIRRSGIKKILNFLKTYKIFLPYDMEFYLPNDMRLFCVNYDVVSTLPNAFSDNGGAHYESK